MGQRWLCNACTCSEGFEDPRVGYHVGASRIVFSKSVSLTLWSGEEFSGFDLGMIYDPAQGYGWDAPMPAYLNPLCKSPHEADCAAVIIQGTALWKIKTPTQRSYRVTVMAELGGQTINGTELSIQGQAVSWKSMFRSFVAQVSSLPDNDGFINFHFKVRDQLNIRNVTVIREPCSGTELNDWRYLIHL